MRYYTYVLRSQKDNTFYIGISENPEERLKTHNSGGSKYTKGRRPYLLIHREEFVSRIEARKREKYLKSGVGRELFKKCFLPVKY